MIPEGFDLLIRCPGLCSTLFALMRSQSQDANRAQLVRVLESQAFMHAERMRRLLRFVGEHALSSPDQPLKEIVIGVELYASQGGFDPRLTSVVRVDAARLRTRLHEYYAAAGLSDRIVIELPKGCYVPVFREASTDAASQPMPRESRPEPSVAVLPFSNLSPEPEDYFSDGLTEEIIHTLSSSPGIRVVARASAFVLKFRNADVQEIGRALNVRFVLEGSVRKSGATLRVTMRLADTSDGYQLWSRRYDRKIQDLFAVQDEIALAIADVLRGDATEPAQASPNGPVEGFEAYEWYLRGRHHLNRQTKGEFHRAIECFEEASARSPGYAPALAAKAVAWLYLGLFSMEWPSEAMPKALEAAARALEIDEANGDALSVSACFKAMFEWDWQAAETLFRKALEVQPKSDLSAHLYALFLLLPMARMEEALAMLDHAKRIDPLSLLVSASRAAVLLMSRRTGEAEQECSRALELDANFWRAIVGMGRCHEAGGRYVEAMACFEHAKAVGDNVPTAIGALGRAYALAGRRKDAQRLLDELDELAKRRYVSPYGRALIYLGLGDDEVFAWLERSYHERAVWLMFLATDPRFDPLRGDTRFCSLLKRLNLPTIAHPVPVSQ
jgi:TolB-like protein/Tfp pilus assembly protein PilF